MQEKQTPAAAAEETSSQAETSKGQQEAPPSGIDKDAHSDGNPQGVPDATEENPDREETVSGPAFKEEEKLEEEEFTEGD